MSKAPVARVREGFPKHQCLAPSSHSTWNCFAIEFVPIVLTFLWSSCPLALFPPNVQPQAQRLRKAADRPTASEIPSQSRNKMRVSGENSGTESPAKQVTPRTPWAPRPNSFEEGSWARGFLGMEQGASGGLKSGLALTDSSGFAHTGFVVSPWRPQAAAGLQHPHALGSDDDEGLRPRGPGYTPRAAILALRASRVPVYFLPLPAVPPRARTRHPHWTAAPGRANQRKRGALAGGEVSRELTLREDVWAACEK